MFRKALDDEELLPQNIVHKDKKFTYKLTDEDKVTLDIDNHNIMEYNYLDENFRQEGDKVPYFRSDLTINGEEIIKIESEMVEWAEHTLLHKVNEARKDKAVESIAIDELEAKTAIAQEYVDFLMRLVKDNERLKSLEIKNINCLDEPLDKGLLERVAKKTDEIIIGPMP